MGKKVAVFGSFVVDLMARAEHLPKAGETVKGSVFKLGAGGKGFNQGIAAHKAGADVAMITKMGRDSFADVALNVMDELSFSKEHILYNEEVATGSAVIMVDEKTSQNQIIIVPGACSTITAEEVDGLRSLLEQCEYVLLQLEVNQDANERLVDLAVACGCKVILNTAPYQPVSDEFLSKIYMVTPNEVEAEMMTGVAVDGLDAAKKAAKVFYDKGVKIVIITLGGRGVFLSVDGREEILPAFQVKAVDTTGAGDAFNGGLLAALSEGMDIWAAARFANALAALSVQKIGTTPSMPTRKEVEAFLAEHE
ncbi:MAG: ribokinase [Selenomonadaceae bacterium]|nr:ribokinase [Selenomonadaceae bacterium]